MTKRAAFTKEFKREAVRLAKPSGGVGNTIADDPGIGLSALARQTSIVGVQPLMLPN